ncbi:protein kinase domain-containing protein [Methylocella sp.]|uniref:serine/threonine-protein kinase n=1 Tax=Methylocella sp. TaxID=1978226 RepID=UPI003783310E
MERRDADERTRTGVGSRPPRSGAPARGGATSGGDILRPGARLNGVYEIDALLTRGGMGEIYRGHAIQTGDPVAIKVIRDDLADSEVALALFRSEASKLHRLHHEAIVRYFVFSADPELARAYLAMEFVEGEPLSQKLARGGLPPGEARRLAIRVAQGLGAAHRRDIVHRDVSPDNIIIPEGGVDEAKIIDFGIARSAQAGTTLIDVGFAGKLNYASPEQLGHYGGEVGPRSDVYSLGLTLAEALRGAPLDMNGTQVEIIEKRKTVPDLAGVDPRLRPVIARMLAPDPGLRQQSMEEVAADFERVRLDAPPTPAAAPRARARLLAAAGIAALALAAVLWFFAHAPKAPPAARQEARQEVTEEAPAQGAPVAPPEKEPTAPKNPLAFVEAYDGGPCFAVLSAQASGAAAQIEAAGASLPAFGALNAAFRAANGFEADVKAVLTAPAQCPAVDFFRAAKASGAPAPQVSLDAPFLRAGEALTGTFAAPPGRVVAAALIDDEGALRPVPQIGEERRRGDFRLAVGTPKAAGRPLLLLLVSSAAPLPALGAPGPAGEALKAAGAQAAAQGEAAGAALAYVYVAQ